MAEQNNHNPFVNMPTYNPFHNPSPQEIVEMLVTAVLDNPSFSSEESTVQTLAEFLIGALRQLSAALNVGFTELMTGDLLINTLQQFQLTAEAREQIVQEALNIGFSQYQAPNAIEEGTLYYTVSDLISQAANTTLFSGAEALPAA